MSFSVNTNIASLQAQEYIRQNSEFQAKTINRVSSGLRIISSGDDAAGLAIANGFRSDQAVLTQGIRNANDGLSQMQIIDGGINNISKLLDRARTLATQSATGTFTGSRAVLSSEFTSVIGEIDRQAQAIGLNTGGDFAKSLSVFVGGGRGATSAAVISNGAVGVDLTQSTVDAKSLGLKGLQAQGNSAVNLNASSTTSVQAILADTTNTSSEATSGYTSFSFAGPGFSDASKISVAVNLSNVNDTATLAAAINTAIQSAGNGANSSATAFKNAGISASIVTDSTGGQHLAFNSATTAFQVQAGDRAANGLLGNISSGATGSSLATTVTASAATTSGTTTATVVRFQGSGLSAPVDISVASGATTAAGVASLSSQVANNASLKAAGITLTTASGTLAFTSSHGEKFSVTAGGDTANLLGLGSSKLGAASAVDYTTLAGTAYTATTSGTATLEFSLNGAASAATAAITSAVSALAATTNTNGFGATALTLNINGTAVAVDFSLDPNKGGAETRANVVKYINSTARTALSLGANIDVAALDGSNNIILTSPKSGATSSVAVTANATSAALGLTADASTNVAAAGTGTNGVSISLSGGTATAAVGQGSAVTATIDTTAATLTGGVSLVFTVDGTAVTADFATDANKGAAETQAQIALFVNTAAQKALGTSATIAQFVNNKLTITSPSTGISSAISVADTGANSISRALGLTSSATALTGAGVGPTGADLANRLNTAFASTTSLQASGLQASFSAGALTISSSNSTFFQVNSRASAGSDIGFGITGVGFAGNAASAAPATSPSVDAGGANQSAAFDFTALRQGNDDQTITLSANSNGTDQSLAIHLSNNGTARNARSLDEAISTINSQLQQSNTASLQKIVAVKEDLAGVEKVRFVSNGSFSVAIGSNASGSGFGSQSTTAASTVSAGGGTADISSQSSAQNAVSALSAAVASLGSAQAVVGKGQNQFNYAVNLAQNQLGNLAASESRIRDADLASEAANLTKAQITLQAGIAALGQANSAPQAILTLLRG